VVRLNQVTTLDAPRQITIANTEPAGSNSFTVVGTDAAGNAIRETMVSTGAALTTSQSFATVTELSCSAPLAAAVSISTATTATAQVRLDDWVGQYVSFQCAPSGGANYTLQQTFDDPNSPTNPVPLGQMNWVNNPAAALVGATTVQQGAYGMAPLWVRVVLNAVGGAVTATFLQPGGGGGGGGGGGSFIIGNAPAVASANQVYAGPGSGAPGAPSFRPLTSADLPGFVDTTAFTPVFTFGIPADLTVAYTTQRGFYTRIGHLIIMGIELAFTPTYTPANVGGSVTIQGQPGLLAATLQYWPLTLELEHATFGVGNSFVTAMLSAANIFLFASVNSQAGQTILNPTAFPTGSAAAIRIAGSYIAA
jgi:hypothetical protein